MIITTVSGASTVSGSPVNGILLAIHAGAGDRSKDGRAQKTAQAERDLRRALDAGYALLEQGAPAEDAVCAAIHVMEDAPEFNAGRGAALTSEGKVSMDACLTDRRRRGRLRRRADHGPASDRCGPGGQGARQAHDVRAAGRGPAALVGHRIARSVVFRDRGTPAFAGTRPIRGRRLGEARHDRRGGEGCRRTCGGGDVHGRHHEPDAGRVGDSPLPGCGTYAADDSVAVSCTGIGEAFVRSVAAHQIADLCGSPASQCRSRSGRTG